MIDISWHFWTTGLVLVGCGRSWIWQFAGWLLLLMAYLPDFIELLK